MLSLYGTWHTFRTILMATDWTSENTGIRDSDRKVHDILRTIVPVEVNLTDSIASTVENEPCLFSGNCVLAK